MSVHTKRTRFDRVMSSASNYWLMLVADVLGAALLLFVGLRSFSGSAGTGVAIACAGAGSWSAIEYAIHRWVLHGPPSAVQRAHARHHRDATALISAPAFLSTALVVATWAVLTLLLDAATAALIVGGLYAGYNYYALLHHVQHQYPAVVARIGWLARLDRAHRVHHRRYVVNYGVTTGWLDRLFGSDERSRPTRVPAVTATPDVAPAVGLA